MCLEKLKEKSGVCLKNPLIKTSQKSIFKPIIASSLALFLGANFAYAQCYGDNTKPIMCVGNLGSENLVDILGWRNLGNTDFFYPDVGSGIQTSLDIVFTDTTNRDIISKTQVHGKAILDTYANSVVINGKTKNIYLTWDLPGNPGSITVDFNDKNNKNFTLDLSPQTSRTEDPIFGSLYGNLIIKGQTKNSTFNALLRYGMKGNIEINSEAKATIDAITGSQIRGNITSGLFGGNLLIKNAYLKGNIGGQRLDSLSAQDLTIVFQNSTMEGDIITGTSNGNVDFQRKNITFKAGSTRYGLNSLVGNIISYGIDRRDYRNKGNHVVFESGSMKGSIRAIGDSSYRMGYNEVIFKSFNSILEGSVEATGGYTEISATNRVVFEKSGNIIGNITSRGSDQGGGRVFGGRNEIVFINTPEGESKITGNVEAISGSNEITFEGGRRGIIEGSVTTSRTDDFENLKGSSGSNTINIKNTSLLIRNNTSAANQDPILNVFQGTSVVNFEGERATLMLQRTTSELNGLIYNRDPNSVVTLNFNAKDSKIIGGVVNNNNATLNVNLKEGVSATIEGNFVVNDGILNLTLGERSELNLNGDDIGQGRRVVSNIKSADNATINIMGGPALKELGSTHINNSVTFNITGQVKWQEDLIPKQSFQTFEIGHLYAEKPLNFIVRVDPKSNIVVNGRTIKSDRVVIPNNYKYRRHYLRVVGNLDDLIGKELYKSNDTNSNIALATAGNGNVSEFVPVDTVSDFSLIGYEFIAENSNKDAQNEISTYTSYYLKSVYSKGASLANQLASASALGANYDLYLANLNSLNKRMGELRNNANSQGAWVRIFNGMQTSKFALETKSIYTTIQAGYDYAFGFNGANNYVGFALSYANSFTNPKSTDERVGGLSTIRGINKINSNAVEFAIYNAYVQDGASKESIWENGLYSDSILKFSYITSKLDLLGQTEAYDTSNFAITFSQELGYRFLAGKSKEIFIDPQVEVALGYLNQSNLKQKLGTSTLDGVQNSIFTVRTRVGSSFGYDFKNFTQDKGFNSKIYLGTYFVNDYISGGDVSLTDKYNAKVSLSPLSTTSRFVLNVGTNFSIKD
ncbi:autotransporter outer membrane beta-barrel domain-containing protein, partial [Helicobacter sp. 'CLO3_human']|uniref:autotransporter outer membrane beta-barrel domain-containing protein n=1 Tax=Helicobacter sp. 'CLO3_human' TaxID=2020249 RepID=UPI0013154B51